MRNARKSRGFTQERLSDVSGVSVRHIAKIEKGVINPSFDILEKLITALGTSFDAFYNPASDKEAAELQEIVGLYRVHSKTQNTMKLLHFTAKCAIISARKYRRKPGKGVQFGRMRVCIG